MPEHAPQGLCPKCLFAGLAAPTEDGANAAAQVPVLTPEELAPSFPQLEILACLGRGGMGVVYKARQKSLNRVVALKLLAPERAEDPQFAKRFEREAQALAALNHPNIVAVYDFGQAGGFYFLLMEFVDGVNLRQAMKAGRFTPEQALAIVPPVCEALQYAHEHGIVHRDIKPENLLLDKEGRVKIADFGIAQMLGDDSSLGLAESQPAGTPQYMAPEQKEHQRLDHRADIYSLGVVLYEMLTGELPAGKLQPPSRKVQIDVRLDEIVLRALETKPELRYRTAMEFKTELDLLAAGRSKARTPEDTTRAKQIAWGLTGCIATGLLIIGAHFLRQAAIHRAAESAEAAQQLKALNRNFEIPALREHEREFPDSAGKLSLWVDQGWLLAKREAKGGELEWQVVLARVAPVETPQVTIQPEDGSVDIRYGKFFVRENLGELRVLREDKSHTRTAWPQFDLGKGLESMGFGGRGPIIAGWKADGWHWFTTGPDRDRPDAWVRLLPEKLMNKGFGFTGQPGITTMFADALTVQDDGTLIVAKRMPFFIAEQELKMRQTRVEHGPAPELEVTQWLNVEGALSLAGLRGKVVVLDFWGQWCGPCVEKLPKTEALHQRFKDRGVVVIGVHSSWNAENVDAFVKSKQINFPVAVDAGGTAERYAVHTWPTYYLVDKAGRIVSGGLHDLPEDSQIEALLKQEEGLQAPPDRLNK